jgi:hypothetical protein
MEATYTTALGTVEPRGKVHFVFSFGNSKPSCDRNETITATIGTIDGDGLPGTIAAVMAAGIRPSRLCAHCFAIRTRKAIADAYKAKT